MKKPRVSHAHELIVKTAKELCGAHYEELMKNDKLFAAWKAKHSEAAETALQGLFIEHYYPGYLEVARATLTGLLNTKLDPILKDQIADALIKDQTLRRGRRRSIGGFTEQDHG